MTNYDLETDVLVVGGGACGFAAAIAARDEGCETAILEKLARVGGNSALSTASVPGAGTRFQRAAGIEDSPDRMFGDLMAQSGPHDCPELTRVLADTSASLVEWLADRVEARIGLITEYRHVGHSVPRLHAPRSRRGQDLVDDLVAAANRRQIPIAEGNPVSRLLADDHCAVIGAAVKDAGGKESLLRARKVVLATNGFAANRDLVREFCPEVAKAEYFGALGSTGEAILWGRALGADIANAGAYQGYAAIAYPQGSLLSWTTMEKGGILVGADGRRFGDESIGYSGYTRSVMAQGEFAFAVFDERIRRVADQEEEFRELVEHRGVKQGGTIKELAAAFGLDAGVLGETIEAYNRAARGETRDGFGRRNCGLAPLVAPYFIARVKPGLFHTQGGLRVDSGARVLRPDGTPVRNLFAGGGAAAGVSGRTGCAGYSSGNGLLAALGLGRLAGISSAQEIRDGR